MKSRDYKDHTDLIAHTLRGEGFDASEDGTGRGTPLVPVAFSGCDDGGDAQEGVTPTLRVASGPGRLSGGQNMAVAIQERAISENPDAGPDGAGVSEGLAYTLESRQTPQAVAFAQNQRDELREMPIAGALAAEPGMKQQTYIAIDGELNPHDNMMGTVLADHRSNKQPVVAEPFTITERGRDGEPSLEYRQDGTSNAILTPSGGRGGMGVRAIANNWAVRRLTPRECERLQGFPDDYTQIPWLKKPADQCPDGPRYKALGNSIAVPVLRWIGERIMLCEEVKKDL
jgi:DNA (cytosine-5)-methyltransferase 1